METTKQNECTPVNHLIVPQCKNKTVHKLKTNTDHKNGKLQTSKVLPITH